MKTIKARYYEATKEIIPLNPQPLRVNGVLQYERSGTDEIGEFIVIDFVSDGDTFLEYDPEVQSTSQPIEIKITEEEWNSPVKATEIIDTQKYLDALAEVPTSQKSITTNTETSQPTSTTDTKKSILTIGQRFSNVWDAIKLVFQP